MIQWFQNNMPTIVVGLIVFAILALVVVRMVKQHKSGQSSCGCGCGSCAAKGSCHPSVKSK